jgi:hypothetical protein
VYGPGIPTISPQTGDFVGGIRTNYRSFIIPKYPRRLVNMDSAFESEEEDDDKASSYPQNGYDNDKQRPCARPSGN